MKALRLLLAFVFVVTVSVTILPAEAQGQGRGAPPVVVPTPTPEVMNEDPQTETLRNDRMGFPAFKIIGNVYYVGTAFASSYLITTPEGNIVINSNREETIPLMKAGIESLGFKLEDTRILLGSHAHGDHQSADALFKQMTGATTMFMEQDVPALRNMRTGDKEHPIDRILKDGDTVTLGGATLTAHFTPGHTRGCTTYTMQATEGGRTHNVLFLCGGLPDDMRLVYNTGVPNIADEWAQTVAKWKTLPCDVFLGSHSWFFNLSGKYKRMMANPSVNPWIDPDGYRAYVDYTEKLREKLIAEQTAAGPPAPRGGGRGGAGGGRGN